MIIYDTNIVNVCIFFFENLRKKSILDVEDLKKGIRLVRLIVLIDLLKRIAFRSEQNEIKVYSKYT